MNQPVFHRLENGLKVAFWPLNHLHSVGVGLYARVGSRYEDPEKVGISHFLEHVLFRGNAQYPTSLEMNRAFEGWGGAINAYTTREYTYYYGRLHPDYLKNAVQFMSDFIHEPLFADVDVERKIILEERLEDVDSDGQDIEVDDISRLGFWGDHPFGNKIIGVPASIRKIQAKHLKEHFERFYGTENLALVVTGRFEPEDILPVIEESFSKLPKGNAIIPEALSKPFLPQEETSFVNYDATQVSLQMSFASPAPSEEGFYHTLLIDRILDDGMSSRLWQRIVEKGGLCYELWTALESYHDVTMWDIGASVAPEKLVQLVEAIYRELDLLREEGPTEEEFELAKRRWRFQQEYALDNINSINEAMGSGYLYDRFLSFEERLQRMESITRSELHEYMKTFLTGERHQIAAVGPLSKSSKKRIRAMKKNF